MATEVETVAAELGFDAPAEVREALAAMGRTEDVRLAPSARKLAFACFARQQIAVADVEIGESEIAVTSLAYLGSPALDQPHGVDFVDDDTVIVGDRATGVHVFRLPHDGSPDELIEISRLDGKTIESPGSVAVRSLGAVSLDVLACNNFADTVTRHALDADTVLGTGEVLVRRWLDLPDGVTVSRSGELLAVSNHNSATVFVYDLETASEDADPSCILRGAHYPHGLRFGRGDRYLAVADAGAPHVHVFVPPGDTWRGVAYPTLTIRVMDDETFARGRHNPTEGGPKGLDIDPGAGVLVLTSECQPLAFFDIGSALERGGNGLAADEKLDYELHVIAEATRERDRLEAAAAEARDALEELKQTKAWRMTLPIRRAYGAARRLKPRRRRSGT